MPAPTFPSTTLPPRPVELASGAVAVKLTSADVTDIANAYMKFTGYQVVFDVCPAQLIASTFKAAVLQKTGTTWAFGEFEPSPGCAVTRSDGVKIPAGATPPFSPPYNTGVFEKQAGGSWVMNENETTPFPCPDNLAVPAMTPGRGTPFLPDAVVHAARVPFKTGCKVAEALR